MIVVTIILGLSAEGVVFFVLAAQPKEPCYLERK
jgi:hypothetical protein